MQTYLFYDIESTGLNKAFDQVLQFAAIRTDLQLKELERYELKVKLNPDITPSPYAVMTHQIGIDECLQGTDEFHAIQQIHQWLNTPGTISMGYNTLGFDDEFLRFSFYRNLLPPYTHQYMNQCGRLDLYPIALMFYLYKNDVIRWPTLQGKPSLKLEYLNTENQFVQARSHHAMTDVEVTLALARQFYQAQDMWEYVLGYFNKKTDQDRFQQLPHSLESNGEPLPEGLMVLGKFGTNSLYQSPVLFLGNSLTYKGQGLWLRLDSDTLQATTESTIPENTWVVRKKFGEPGFVLPPKERFLQHIHPERQARVEANNAWLKQHPELLQKIIQYHRSYTYPVLPQTDSEASLYLQGFWSDEETRFCQRFHRASPQEKASMTQNVKTALLRNLAIRILGKHFPEAMTVEQKAVFEDYLQTAQSEAVVDFRGEKRLGPVRALGEIEELRGRGDMSDQQLLLLEGLEKYLKLRLSLTQPSPADR